VNIFSLSPAPGQILADQLHMNVFNSTVARVEWSRPYHPNGPIDNYIVEYTLVDKNRARTWNKTRPGNETKMNVSVECNGEKVVIRVRVAAINRIDSVNLKGNWSETKNETLCDTSGIHVFYISNRVESKKCVKCLRMCVRKCWDVFP